MIDDRDIDRAASKLQRYGKDFDLLKEGILAYEEAKAKRVREECPTCNGSGKAAISDFELLNTPMTNFNKR